MPTANPTKGRMASARMASAFLSRISPPCVLRSVAKYPPLCVTKRAQYVSARYCVVVQTCLVLVEITRVFGNAIPHVALHRILTN